MNIQLTKHFDFEAAHFLPCVPKGHKCGRMHGHSYRVKLVLEGEEREDVQHGMLVDYADIAEAWAPIHEMLDHRTLNDVEGLKNPTTEVLAPWIYRRLRNEKTAVARLLHYVTVEESRTTSCTYPAP